MAEQRDQRRLAAIMVADVVGYSRLMGQDEAGTLARLKKLRAEFLHPKVAEHGGRIVNTTGDGTLVEFASAVDAVKHAIDVQRGMMERNAGLSDEERIDLRLGINVGDIIIDGDDIYGDGVNVAARLEGLAEPGGIYISGTVFDQIGSKLDLTVDDLGPQSVKNIAEPVRTYRIRIEAATLAAGGGTATPPLPEKPSIAVLPFQNMSGDSEQEYFADGVVEEIITELSRIKWLFVIARNSSFAYKGKSPDIRQVGRELGVRYVLEGSLRKAANRVRISGQLIDAINGAHIWADRFEGGLDDIFELQDQITSSVVGAIEPALTTAEMRRANAKPTESLDAYDCFLQALALFHGFSSTGFENAVALCRKAITIDPQYATPYGLAARSLVYRVALGWASNVEIERNDAIEFARKAIDFGTDDPAALWMGGHALVVAAGEHDRGLSAINRSLSLNPNSAQAWNASGWTQWNSGDGKTSLNHLQQAMRLSPLDPEAFMFKSGMGWANFIEGNYEEAISWADISLSERPNFLTTLRCKVSALGLLGRMEEARAAVHTLLTLQPDATVPILQDLMPLKLDEHMAVYLDGLRKAGIPE